MAGGELMPRFNGPALAIRTPLGRLEEPLRSDVCSQLRRLSRVVAALPPGDVTWMVEVRGE